MESNIASGPLITRAMLHRAVLPKPKPRRNALRPELLAAPRPDDQIPSRGTRMGCQLSTSCPRLAQWCPPQAPSAPAMLVEPDLFVTGSSSLGRRSSPWRSVDARRFADLPKHKRRP